MSAKLPWERLFKAAERARKAAYAPYSHFQVGAAVLTEDGSIISGCNVENASYGLAMCAERNAIARMVVEKKKLRAVAIVVDSEVPTPPCGACRQVIAEHCAPETPISSRTVSGKTATWTLKGLLPAAFTKSFL